MIKAILFDFDDTLGNREEYSHRTYVQRMEEVCPDGDPWLKEVAVQSALIYDQHGEAPKTYVRDRVLETTGIDLGEDFTEYWAAHQCENTVLYDDAVPVLKELRNRGYLLGILTNGESYSQHRKVERCGLTELVDAVTVSGDTDTKKPDPKIFHMTAEKLGLKPEECAFVGDMYSRDVYGAHLAGMKPVWIWPHGDRRTDLDEVIRIRSLSELTNLFPDMVK